MKKNLLLLTYGVLSLLHAALAAQTPEKALNQNKIELLLRNVTVTRTSSNGAMSSYQTEAPQLRFNDGPEVDYKPATILLYLADCPRAAHHVELFQEKKKKSRRASWTGYLAGGGLDPGLEKSDFFCNLNTLIMPQINYSR